MSGDRGVSDRGVAIADSRDEGDDWERARVRRRAHRVRRSAGVIGLHAHTPGAVATSVHTPGER
ncbi:hypothetical protein GCM10023083_61320 [Streptomyces phyllanthi]